jgi:hypothetical protein
VGVVPLTCWSSSWLALAVIMSGKREKRLVHGCGTWNSSDSADAANGPVLNLNG